MNQHVLERGGRSTLSAPAGSPLPSPPHLTSRYLCLSLWASTHPHQCPAGPGTQSRGWQTKPQPLPTRTGHAGVQDPGSPSPPGRRHGWVPIHRIAPGQGALRLERGQVGRAAAAGSASGRQAGTLGGPGCLCWSLGPSLSLLGRGRGREETCPSLEACGSAPCALRSPGPMPGRQLAGEGAHGGAAERQGTWPYP